MLDTNLKHLETEQDVKEVLESNEKVIICCGRMGPMCIPVYDIFEILREEYTNIQFLDMDFDMPVASMIKNLPECREFGGLPFTVYYRNGEVVKATSSIQSAKDIRNVIKEVYM